MIRAFRILACSALPLALAGCQALSGGGSGSSTHTPSERFAQILESGVLRVGVSGDIPPLNMKNVRGEIVGFEIDIVTALANAMGLELRLEQRSFPDLLPSLRRAEIDMAVSGITITPERNAQVAFAGPYFISGMSVLSRSAEIADAQSSEVLDVEGRTYAALAGSTSADFVRTQLPKAKLVTVPSYADAVRMVIVGAVDGLLADHLACSVALWKHPDDSLGIAATPFTVEPFGIALPPDAPLFLNLVQNFLQTLDDTGLLMSYKAHWLADGSWLDDLK